MLALYQDKLNFLVKKIISMLAHEILKSICLVSENNHEEGFC